MHTSQGAVFSLRISPLIRCLRGMVQRFGEGRRGRGLGRSLCAYFPRSFGTQTLKNYPGCIDQKVTIAPLILKRHGVL